MANEQVEKIIDKYVGKEGVLIQLLLDIQRQENWISKETVTRINERLDIPLSDIYRVATFYSAISLKPRGKHIVRVCAGTACYVRGGQRVLDAAEQAIGIKAGETSSDLKFTLETVNCLGCCALGPVVEINGKYHGTATPKQLQQIIERKRSA
jgi:NADH-quinone oxidoreductase subunit E